MPSLVERYDRLGPKTFLMMLVGRMGILLSFIFLFIVYAFSRPYMPIFQEFDESLVGSISFLVGVLIFLLSSLVAGLEYSNYSIFLERDDLKMRRGIFEIKEEMVPYRHILGVRAFQSVIDRLMGISNITVDLAETGARKMKIILPSLDKNIASDIQRELLKRAETQKINIAQTHKTDI